MSGINHNSDQASSEQGAEFIQNADPAQDEWYDQGFDLSDENDINDSLSQDYSINLNLVKSASEQFSSSDPDPNSAKITPPKVEERGVISAGSRSRGPRTDAIYVGGAGKMVDLPNREYVFSNSGNSSRKTGYTPLGPDDSTKDDGEFGTGSSKIQQHSLSAEDAKFLNSMRAGQNQENQGEVAYNAYQAAANAAKQSDARLQANSQRPNIPAATVPQNSQANAAGNYRLASMPQAAQAQNGNYRLASMPKGTAQEAGSNYRLASMPANAQSRSAVPQGQAIPQPLAAANRVPNPGSSQIGVTGMTDTVSNPAQTQAQATAEAAAAMEAKGSARPNDPTDTNTNRNKSLEELAKEYPDLGPEDLVKLRRSSNRCHLVTRIPVFDANSNIGIYELKFTSGRVFQINALKSQHVYHVLFGYFIRRGISCFIGRGKLAMVMMPITYDLINYIDRFSINRLILRICPEQPVTPSALHLLTSLKRSGMHFAIDMMLLLKKDWNKAILSLEYVMIDLSSKVREQLNVFQRLKLKAPWLKSVGYNDVNHEGYTLLAKHMIDFLDAPFWCPPLNFNQDVSVFAPAQEQALAMINEMFADQPNYQIFLQFLSRNETVSRNLAVFLYRFRHISPRQIQNIQDLYQCLIENSASRSFSVVISYSLLQLYCKSASIASQSVLQEYYAQALIRGYFSEYMAKVFEDQYLEKYAFQAGMFSLLHLFLLREEVEVLIDEQFEPIINRIYGENELLSDIIDCAKALEATDLYSVFKFIQKYELPPASVLVSYEKGIMRTNELLLVLNLVPHRM